MLNHDAANEGWPRAKVALAGFTIVGAVLILFEHRIRLLPYLPWLFLLACPLMHIFHHGRAFGAAWHEYAAATPRIVPHFGRHAATRVHGQA